MRIVIFCAVLLLALASTDALMADVTSSGDGEWSSPTVLNPTPTSSDPVYIQNNVTIGGATDPTDNAVAYTVIIQSQNLTLEGTGSLTLANTDLSISSSGTFSFLGGSLNGARNIIGSSGGTLNLGNGVNLGSTGIELYTNDVPFNLNVSTGSATVQGSIYDYDIPGIEITVPGSLAKTGSGTLVLSGNNTYSNGTYLNEGTLSVSADNNLGAGSSGMAFNGGTLEVTGTGFSAGRETTLNTSGTFQIDTGTLALSGNIYGGGSLTKTGSGTLILSGANTYTGGTTVSSGLLQANTDTALGTGAALVNSSATLFLNGNVTLANNITISGTGAMANAGAIGSDGLGTDAQTVNGTVSLAADTLVTNNGGSSGLVLHDINLGSHTLTIGAAGTGYFSLQGNISGSGGLVIDARTAAFDGGVDSFTGATDVLSTGDLRLENPTGTVIHGDLSIEGIVVDYAGNQLSANTVVTLNGSGGYLINVDGAPLTETFAGLSGTSTSSKFFSQNNGMGPSAPVVVTLSGTGFYSYAGQITESTGAPAALSLIKTGSGTQVLSGVNNYRGGTFLNGGTLSVSADNNLGNASGGLTFTGGTLEITGTGFSSTRTVTLTGAGTFQTDTGSLTLTSNITGTGSLAKTGTGTLILSGANTYSGGTEVSAGILQGNTGTAFGTGAVTVVSGATLDIDGNTTVGNNITISGTGITGQGALFSSGGTATNQTLTGTLNLAANASVGNASGNTDLRLNAIQLGANTLTVAEGTVEFDGSISGSGGLTIATNNAIIEGGQNSFTGLTDVLGGATLILENAGNTSISGDLTIENGGLVNQYHVSGQLSNTSVVTLNGNGQFQIEGNGSTSSDTFAGLQGSSATALVNAINDNTGHDLTTTITLDGTGTYQYAGQISDNGSVGASSLILVMAGTGTQTLSGTSTYHGGTNLNAGTLSVSADNNLGDVTGALTFNGGTLETTASFSSARAVVINTTGTFQTDTGTLTLSHGIAGGGGLTKTGTGELLLTGTSTYSGGTTVNFGTLAISGTGTVIGADSNVTVGLSSGDNGTLIVSGGGQVTGLYGTIGDSADSTGSVTVTGTDSTWNNNDLYVGESGTGTLAISNGGTVTDTGYAVIGDNAGSTGSATVTGTGSVWNNSGALYVGYSGTGTLTISNGGTVTDAFAVLGYYAGSTGSVTVTGIGSTWNSSAGLYVGEYGTGTLAITNGGTVMDDDGYIGDKASSTSSVTVDGTGSAWNNDGKLVVGNLGTGTLAITNGGAVDALSVTLSSTGTAKGIVNIASGGVLATGRVINGSGTGGTALNFNGGILRATGTSTDFISNFTGTEVQLLSGGGTIDNGGFNISINSPFSGAGDLTFTGTATTTLTATNTYTGATTVNAGTLALSGTGSSIASSSGVNLAANGSIFDISGVTAGTSIANLSGTGGSFVSLGGNILTINQSGNNTFAGVIQNGGISGGSGGGLTLSGTGTLTLTNANTYTGDTTVSQGTLAVSGTAAAITDATGNSHVYVGNSNGKTGALTISGGGKVTDYEGFIGQNADSTGSVTVTGAGSKWTNYYSFQVGGSGSGALMIADGGAVSNVDGYITGSSGNTANVTVTGTGSTWTNTGNLYLGISSSGTMTISAGGKVSDQNGNVGTGSVTVTGTGSSWANSGSMSIGNGTLMIADGGKVSDSSSDIGDNNGVVIVTGTGSLWTTANLLKIGSDGNGTVTVSNGGTVLDDDGFIGVSGNGNVSVTGTGSSWTSTDLLLVGNSSTGTLTVSNGGIVTGSSVILAASGGGGGTVNLQSGGILATGQASNGGGSGGAAFNFDGGILRATGATTNFISGFSGTQISLLSGGGTIDNSGFNITIKSPFTGTGALTFTGTATTTLTATNTYTGATAVNTGTLALSGAGSIANSSGINLAQSGSTFDISGLTGTTTSILNLSGTAGSYVSLGAKNLTIGQSGTTTYAGIIHDGGISGGTAGSLTLTGTGVLKLTGANTYTGPTQVSSGTLIVAGSILSTVHVLSGATLGGTGSTGAATIDGGGKINLQDGMVGTLTVGGLSSGGGTASSFSFDIQNVAGTTTLDSINDIGSLTLSGTTIISIGMLTGSGSLTLGTYTLLTYTGTQQSLDNLELSTTSLDGMSLTLVQTDDVISLFVGPTSTTYDLGTSVTDPRVISGGTTGVAATITNTGTGTDDTLTFTGLTTTGTVTGGTVPLSGGPVATDGGTATGTGTLSVGTTLGITTITATVATATNTTLTTTATLQTNTSGTVDVVTNRVVTATDIDFGRVMVDQTVSSTSMLSTTGSDEDYTRVTVGTASANGISATGGTDPTFDSASVTDTRTVSGSFSTTGNTSGSLTLVTAGENLAGESPINVTLNYAADAVANRVVTATSVDFGRVMLNQTVSSTSTLSTTGDDADFTRVTVGTVGPDFNGISATGGANPTFDSASVTDFRNVTGTFSTAGSISGTLILATGAEGLAGESPINVALTYTADAVAKRVVTDGTVTDLGVLHNGATISGTTEAFTTTGTYDTTTSVSVAAGNGTADSNGVTLNGNATTFDGTTSSDTRTLGGTITNTTGGTTTGSFNLAVTTLENGGVGLNGEGTYNDVNVAYSAFVYTGQGIWTTNGSGTWGTVSATPANWQANGGTPGLDSNFTTTDSATFGDSVTSGTATITLDGDNPSINSITFNDSEASYTIAQGTGGGITLNGGSTSATVTDLAGSHTISAPITLATNVNVSVSSAQQLTMSGSISGNGSITKQDAGTLILSGTNSYTGGTNLNGGNLSVSADNNLGASSGGLVFNSGTLETTATFGSARDLTLDGNGAIQTDTGTLALFGNITGTGSLSKNGDGSLILAGSNTYSGGTTLNDGTIVLASNQALGTGALTTVDPTVAYLDGVTIANTINLTGATTLEVDNADTAMQSGVISGSGPLTKDGTGALILTVANTYSGGTTINAGALVIGNSAALGTGDVLNNGTLLTSGSNHLINVGGNYTQGTGGTLLLNLYSPTVYDSLNLTGSGTAHLNGTLVLNLQGSFAPGSGQEYNVVTTNNPISGQFSSITTNLPTISGTVSYTNDVTILYQNSFANLPSLTLNPNQLATATYIDQHDKFITSVGFASLVGALNGASSDPQALTSAFNQLTPVNFANFASSTAFNNAAFSFQQLDGYLGNHRGADGTFVSSEGGLDYSGLAINDPNIDPGLQSVRSQLLAWSPAPSTGLLSDSSSLVLGGMDMKDIAVDNTPTNLWNVFVTGNVVLAQNFSDPSAGLPYNSSTTGAAQIGVDYRITKHFLIGATFGYGHTNATLDSIGSGATVNTYSPGVYASYTSNGFFANVLSSYGFSSYSQNRNVSISGFSGTANSSPGGDQILGNLDGGYEFHRGNWTFGPTLGLGYTHLSVDGYSETGLSGADLTVDQDQSNSLRSRLGAAVSYAVKSGDLIFTPHLSAGWQHEFMDQSRGITSQFSDIGAGSFVVNTPNPSRDSAIADLGLNAQVTNKLTVFSDYSVQGGQSNYFGQSIQAGLKIGF